MAAQISIGTNRSHIGCPLAERLYRHAAQRLARILVIVGANRAVRVTIGRKLDLRSEASMCQTDEHCIAECLNGRPDVFRFLVVRYERPLLGYLTRRMGDPDAAAEVTQESFVRAYFRLGTLKKDDAFFAWLLGIAAPGTYSGLPPHAAARA